MVKRFKESARSHFESRGSSKQLILVIHGTGGNPERMSGVRRLIEKELPDADIWIPYMGIGVFTPTPYDSIIRGLMDELDERVDTRNTDGEGYQEIRIIGYSAGSLLARKLYAVACGEHPEVPFGKLVGSGAPKAWAPLVSRIVLLAGINRGWKINVHLSRKVALQWHFGTALAWFLSWIGRKPNVFEIRRGEKFITELRLQWMRMRNAFQKKERDAGGALTIQLLGTIDDLVSPEDNIDLVSGSDFVYLDVPFSGHESVLEVEDQEYGERRAEVFRKALVESGEALQKLSAVSLDEQRSQFDRKVKSVVFVIHGIRDVGHWTNRIGRRIKLAAPNKDEVVIESSSYGFFPMIQFFLPWKRREKVAWFMDRYAEARAKYPEASFSFVGHSHGTYLLARALKDSACCHFENVAFAGSVVPTNFPWEKYLKNDDPERRYQVEKMANYVATSDWVVAFFPKNFEFLRIKSQDLGSAGHDGFKSEQVENVRYVAGEHSAAIQEKNWQSLAEFIVSGKKPEVDEDFYQKERVGCAKWIERLGKFPQLVVLVILGILILLGLGLVAALGWIGAPQGLTALAVAAYVSLIWWVLNKF